MPRNHAQHTMIVGIGFDCVAIQRCVPLTQRADARLARVFSHAERTYARACSTKAAERFAARFAAKEAVFKALTQAVGDRPCSFARLCRTIEIRTWPAPSVITRSNATDAKVCALVKAYDIYLSMSHTQTEAYAYVIATSRDGSTHKLA